jgi:uncharacterized protein (DUF433 family)
LYISWWLSGNLEITSVTLRGTRPYNRALYLKSMETVTEIGSMISRRPDIRGGRPCIAGTGVSVRRIAQWRNMGLIPEEIARKFGHLSLPQVHAALAYYHANQAEIDADLEAEALEADAIERQHQR